MAAPASTGSDYSELGNGVRVVTYSGWTSAAGSPERRLGAGTVGFDQLLSNFQEIVTGSNFDDTH